MLIVFILVVSKHFYSDMIIFVMFDQCHCHMLCWDHIFFLLFLCPSSIFYLLLSVVYHGLIQDFASVMCKHLK